MAKGKNTKKKNPSEITALPTTRSTRSTTKAVMKAVNTAEPTESVANPTHPKAMQQKRKRAMTSLSEQGAQVVPQKKPHISNSPDPASDETSDKEGGNTTVKRSARVAPARPNFLSDPESGEEDEVQASDGLVSSDMESGALTAKQINAERPIPVPDQELAAGASTEEGTTIHGPPNIGKVGRRAKQVLSEVPSVVQSPPPIEGNVLDAAPGATSLAVLPVVPDPVLASVMIPPITPLPQPGNIWSAATHLVVGDDGRLQQSAQSSEISKCISKAVRLANSNIFFVNAFPNLEEQNRWLSQSLITVLEDRAQTDLVVREVNLRARQDNRYTTALISMMTSRWSNARQRVIDTARVLIISKECTYAISGLGEADRAAEVKKLLDDEAFHFGKANSGSMNKAAPYQHPEITLCLSHFFGSRNDYGTEYSDRFHRGKYGLQMPQPMVALIATAIQAALKEWATGVQTKRPFTETDNREPYRDHLAAMQTVRDSENGQSKYERLLSRIYIQTMNHLNSDNLPTTSAPKKKSVIDTDGMEA